MTEMLEGLKQIVQTLSQQTESMRLELRDLQERESRLNHEIGLTERRITIIADAINVIDGLKQGSLIEVVESLPVENPPQETKEVKPHKRNTRN